MGLLSNSLKAIVPSGLSTVATAIPSWEVGREQDKPFSYDRAAREGYKLDELVYACVTYRMKAMGEAPMVGFKQNSDTEEKLEAYDHEAVYLLNNPNPYMGRSRLWKITSMHLDLAGDAYWHKVRSKSGKLVQLWPLRPDRMAIIPDSRSYISGYKYTIGDKSFSLSPDEVIHFQTEHPLNDYYGLSTLEILAARVDLDIAQRRLISAFFNNAGIPFGMINIQRRVNTEEEREAIRRQFRADLGGANAWRVGVLDGGQATYTAMGMPLGDRGVAMPAINEQTEARICAVFGLSPSLIATSLGMGSSSYANRVSDRDMFWDQEQVPRYRDVDDALTNALRPEYPDITRFEHDLSKVRALQEDEDKKHKRIREDFFAAGITWDKYIAQLGGSADDKGMLVLPANMITLPTSAVREEQEEPPPLPQEPVVRRPREIAPAATDQGSVQPNSSGVVGTNGVAH